MTKYLARTTVSVQQDKLVAKLRVEDDEAREVEQLVLGPQSRHSLAFHAWLIHAMKRYFVSRLPPLSSGHFVFGVRQSRVAQSVRAENGVGGLDQD